MELKLKLTHNNICRRLDCVKIKKCVCLCVYKVTNYGICC